MNKTPVDKYNFWKELVEDKSNNREPVSVMIYRCLIMAEMEMKRYLMYKKTNAVQ